MKTRKRLSRGLKLWGERRTFLICLIGLVVDPSRSAAPRDPLLLLSRLHNRAGLQKHLLPNPAIPEGFFNLKRKTFEPAGWRVSVAHLPRGKSHKKLWGEPLEIPFRNHHSFPYAITRFQSEPITPQISFCAEKKPSPTVTPC